MTAMQQISAASSLPATTFTIPANNAELGEAITRLAGHINAAQYRFLKLLAALVERKAWLGGSGMKSPAHWLNYYCGIDLGAAREKVRVAKCLAALPLIDAAFSTGVISYSKVRAMTRSATPENEAFLLQVARHGTAQHVEKMVRGFARATRLADPRADACQHEAREFSWYHDDDDMLVFKGRLPAVEGAAFVKAMDAVLHSLAPRKPDAEVQDLQDNTLGNVSAETCAEVAAPSYAQKRADALCAMADLAMTALAVDGKPPCAADKYQVVIHIDASHAESVSAETSSQQSHSAEPVSAETLQRPCCTLESDGCHFPLSSATVRRLACDASLITVLEDADGNVLNVGRKTRSIPPALRRALMLRDHGCRFPGCCETRFVDAHHIQHWCDGGETRLDNLILLCRHHHTLLHQQGFRIVQSATGFEFERPDGHKFPRALSTQFAAGDDLPDEDGRLFLETDSAALGLSIDARTTVTLWQGESLDYGFAVGTLMSIAAARAHAPGLTSP